MSTPTTYMGLPNPTPFGDAGTWASDIVSCINGFDGLAVNNVVSVSVTGSLSVYNGPALIKADATGGAIVLTLPDATIAANKGRVYFVVKVDSSGNTVTIQGFGGQTLSGSASSIISTQWHGAVIQSDGANWVVSGVFSPTTTGTGSGVLATSPSISGATLSGALSITGTATYTTANPTFFSSQGSGAVVLATSPAISGATLSGTITISGTASYTTANPTFFSAQGNGSKVQLSTGTFTNGDVVTQDANGNTVDSGTLLSSLASTASVTAKPNLYDISGAAPAAGDNHIASGVATLAAGTVTITLTGSAVFTSNTTYVVQLTYETVGTTTVTTTAQALLFVTKTSGSVFSINNGDATDSTSTVAWTAVGF